MVKIIADPGSCHLGKIELAKELIHVAKESGADAIKFQLFKNLPPNIELPYEWIPELKDYADSLGIEFFGSVWDDEGWIKLYNVGCKSIKYSYSMAGKANDCIIKNSKIIKFKNVYVSGDIMNPPPWWSIKLYCIPLYPVPYVIDFENIFPRFDGFSSHCLGISQDIDAIACGAKYIEKHFRLDNDECEQVPDGKFAIMPNQLEQLCKVAKG